MTRSSPRTTTSVHAAEWGVVLALAVASIVFVVAAARHGWFRSDVWDYLTQREIGSAADLLRHHAGHLAIYGILSTRIGYGLVGLDFSPLYPSIGAAVWAAFAVIAWRWLRHRDTHPVVAMAAAGVLLFMSTAGWLTGWFIDTPVAFAGLLGALTIATVVEQPGTRHQLLMFGALLVPLTAGGAGAAGVIGFGLAALITTGVRRWWPALTAGALTYGTWYLINRTSAPQLRPSLSASEWLIDVPATTADLWRLTLARILVLPHALGWVLLAGLVVLVWWLIRAGRMDLPTMSLLLGTVMFTVLVVAVKVIPRGSPVGSTRYSHIAGTLLIVALAPHLRLPSDRRVLAAAALVGVVLVGFSAAALHDDIVRFRHIGARSRPYVEAAGVIVAQGEPIIDGYSMGLREGFLRPEGLRMLLEDGWQPRLADDGVAAEVRGDMRMGVSTEAQYRQSGPVGASTTDDLGCTFVPDGGGTAWIDVTGGGVIQLVSPDAPAIVLLWEDRFGTAERTVELAADDALYFRLARPDGPTGLTVTGDDQLSICGLVP